MIINDIDDDNSAVIIIILLIMCQALKWPNGIIQW